MMKIANDSTKEKRQLPSMRRLSTSEEFWQGLKYTHIHEDSNWNKIKELINNFSLIAELTNGFNLIIQLKQIADEGEIIVLGKNNRAIKIRAQSKPDAEGKGIDYAVRRNKKGENFISVYTESNFVTVLEVGINYLNEVGEKKEE